MNEDKRWCRFCHSWKDHTTCAVAGDIISFICDECHAGTPIRAFIRQEKRQLEYIDKVLAKKKLDE